jgi:hypothetical protein
MSLKIKGDGCGLCGSTWGNYWDHINGEKQFFCCKICAESFKNLINAIIEITGWPQITSLEITGEIRNRKVLATYKDRNSLFKVEFISSGEVEKIFIVPT